MSGRSVTFKKIVLEGFGPYRERTEVNFSPGLNNLIADNEQGKSSLVMGIIAVIFGLPARNDPSAFGLARFKNWNSPSRCEGEIEFESGRETYRIKRNFETNRIDVFRREGDGWTGVITGIHNPRTRRGHEAYEELLRELFCLTSQEIFEATFCIIQPLPESKRLGEDLQGLLSGGGTNFERVKSSLHDELKNKTKYTGDRGVTPQNMRNDRELENLEERIQELKRNIEQGRSIVDSLEKIKSEQKSLEEKLDKKKKDLETAKQTRDAWLEWKRLRDNYLNARADLMKVAEDCKKAEELEKSITGSLAELREHYPELEGCSEDTQKALDKLISLRDSLRENKDSLQKICRDIEDEQKEKEKLEEELKQYRGWDILGADPAGRIKTMKEVADDLLKEWNSFEKKRNEIDRIEGCLKEKYSLFQEATDEELAAVKGYTKKESELKLAKEKAEKELESASEKVNSYKKAVEDFKTRYRDIERLAPEVEEAAKIKLDMLKKEKELKDKIDGLKQKLVIAPAARFAGAVVTAFGAGIITALVAGTDNLTISIAAALLGGLAGYAGVGFIHNLRNADMKKQLRKAEKELNICQKEITDASSQLGEFARVGEGNLGALLERFKQYREERTRLEKAEMELPSKEEIEKLQKGFHNARDEYQAFLKLTEKFKENFLEVEESWTEWRNLVDKKEELSAEIQEYALEIFKCHPEEAALANPMNAVTRKNWKELTKCLQAVTERNLDSISCLVSFLKNCSPDWWEKTKEKAAAYADIVEKLKEKKRTISIKTEQKQPQHEKVLQLEKEEEQLAKDLNRILEKTNGDALKAKERWEQRERSLGDIEKKEVELHTILNQYKVDSIIKFSEKKVDAENSAHTSMSKWQDHIDKYPGLPKITEAEEIEKITRRAEAIEKKVEDLEESIKSLEGKWRKLIEEEIRLQGRDVVNIAQAEIELGNLLHRKERLEILIDALTEAFKELNGAIVDYQHSYRNHLQQLATMYYKRITKTNSRNVIIDDRFNVRVEEEGMLCDINQLSKGARDQLYIALRFAVADLLAENIKLPFIFDDPFVSSDGKRLQHIREILDDAQQERQFILLSHNDIFSSWGKKVKKQSV